MNAVRLCNSSKDSSERRRIFYVTGKEGIGKTLLLLRLANDLAKKKICTTVYYVEIEGKDSSILHKCLEMIGIPPDEKLEQLHPWLHILIKHLVTPKSYLSWMALIETGKEMLTSLLKY